MIEILAAISAINTAMANDRRSLIEYSFAEPPFAVCNGRMVTSSYMSPSVHFRHDRRANICWADGHTNSHPMADYKKDNVYGIDSARMNLGWFEPVDNTPFDLE